MNLVDLINRSKSRPAFVMTKDGAIHSKEFVKTCDNFHESYKDYSKDFGNTEK